MQPDPHQLNADLHCHSVFSDGTQTPEQVAQLAHQNGVQIWALTDHDELSGQANARQAAQALGIRFVAGVEISVSFADHTIHIVGLGVDENNATLKHGLARTRGGREARAREMAAGLDKVGIPNAYAGALKYVGNPDLISRTHFARYLVEQKICEHTNEVFMRYLTPGKPGYVPHQWASLSDAVNWIRAAGGQAVIAHPGRYRLTPTEFSALFSGFKELGGEAIEVVTGSHTVAQYHQYAQVAKEYGFMASRGSDFHSPTESRIAPGMLPRLPDSVVPIWHNW